MIIAVKKINKTISSYKTNKINFQENFKKLSQNFGKKRFPEDWIHIELSVTELTIPLLAVPQFVDWLKHQQ